MALAGANQVAILLNDGSGTFTADAPISLAGGAAGVALADFNFDGRLDIATAYQTAGGDAYAAVALGSIGPSLFITPTLHFLENLSPNPSAVATGDVNGDGAPDVLVALKDNEHLMFLARTVSGFAAPIAMSTDDRPASLAVGDLNNDGVMDIVVGASGDPMVDIFRGQLGGSPLGGPTLPVDGSARGVAVADVDGDGYLDVAVIDSAGLKVFAGNGDLAFGVPQPANANSFAYAIAPADFVVQDGKTDFVVTNRHETNAVTFLTNTCTAGPHGFVVSNTNDAGAGSLRAAMAASEANSGYRDWISFAIPGAGPYTIAPASALPQITDAVEIDARTQPGWSGVPLVRLDGGSGGGPIGLWVTDTADGSEFFGLSVTGWSAEGIRIAGDDAIVAASYIGLTPAGGAAGSLVGVYLDNSSNTIVGGASDADRNVISGNLGHGVVITGPTATGNAVSANYIGLAPDGDTAMPNGGSGVLITANAAGGNTVGGHLTPYRNVISANLTGVLILGSPGNFVRGNYIGTNALGTVARGNTGDGIVVLASNTTIGGASSAERNLISGNSFNGILFSGGGATSNGVFGNYIGVNAAGTAAIGNGANGVFVSGGSNNTIGNLGSERNIISGNAVGIHLRGDINQVLANYIGTTANGLNAIPNGVGIWVSDSSGNLIGSSVSPGLGNVISGNSGRGVYISWEAGYTATNTNVLGNFIGTDVNGTGALGNQIGVEIDAVSGNAIGGAGLLARNVISGNSQSGVYVKGQDVHLAANNAVQGNYIGVQVDGASQLSNHGSGVLIGGSTSNTPISGNTIRFNDIGGVFVPPAAVGDSEAVGVVVDANSIDMNGGLGIDLGNAGVDTNDAGDGDGGPNGQQNSPALTAATRSGVDLTIAGSLDSTPATPFTIRFYVSAVCNTNQAGVGPGGVPFGEGRFQIGTQTVSGPGGFTVTITTGLGLAGEAITTTATGPDGTSEFSNCVLVTGSSPEPGSQLASADYGFSRARASIASGSLLSGGRRSRNAR